MKEQEEGDATRARGEKEAGGGRGRKKGGKALHVPSCFDDAGSIVDWDLRVFRRMNFNFWFEVC